MEVVVLGTRGLPPRYGGRETATDEIGRRLVEMGHEVVVYGRGHRLSRVEDNYHGIRVIQFPTVPGKGIDSLVHLLISTLDLICRRRRSVVVLSDVGTSVVLPILKLAGYKTVWWVDGPAWERSKWGRAGRAYLRWAAALGIRQADRVVIDSRAAARHYREHFGRSGVFVPYGASVERVEGTCTLKELGIVSEEYILFVGRLTPEKGVHHLISAYRHLRTDVPLVVVGDNPYDRDYVQRLRTQADERVIFAGYRFGREFAQLMQHCLIYVQPSEVEGTSPVLVTAMGYGRPVVVQGIPQNLETIGDAGLWFEPGRSEQLTELLQDLLDHREKLAPLGARAAAHVRSTYDWDDITRRFVSVCEAALGDEAVFGEDH